MSYCSCAFLLWGLDLWIKINCLEFNIMSTRCWYKYYQRQQQIRRWLLLLQSMALTTLYALVDCFQMISTQIIYCSQPWHPYSIKHSSQEKRQRSCRALFTVGHLMLMNIHQQRAMLLAVQSLALGIRSWASCVSSVHDCTVQAHSNIIIIKSTGTNIFISN